MAARMPGSRERRLGIAPKEPFALTMSSGFFRSMPTRACLGPEENGLLPARIRARAPARWSAGVGGRAPGGRSGGRPESAWSGRTSGIRGRAGLLRGRLFRERLDRLFPVARFDQTRVPVAMASSRSWPHHEGDRGWFLARRPSRPCARCRSVSSRVDRGVATTTADPIAWPRGHAVPEERPSTHRLCALALAPEVREPMPTRAGTITLAIENLPSLGARSSSIRPLLTAPPGGGRWPSTGRSRTNASPWGVRQRNPRAARWVLTERLRNPVEWRGRYPRHWRSWTVSSVGEWRNKGWRTRSRRSDPEA